MRIHVFQHVPFEGPASIGVWANEAGHRITDTRFFADDPLPAFRDFDWLVVMGGPMNIYEDVRHPWLPKERRFIRESIERKKAVLGVCLGAQLIADALGSRVYPNSRKEIGWFPLRRTEGAAGSEWGRWLPYDREVFHWHGDTFDLPDGAVHLARSDGCENQAFSFNDTVLALQFHLEMTPDSVKRLIENCGDEIVEGRCIQPPEAMLLDDARFERANACMSRLLDRFAGMITPSE